MRKWRTLVSIGALQLSVDSVCCLNLIMGLLWMILLVVLVGAEAQNVTEVEELLGKDVTLNCSIRDSDVHWYMESHNQLNWCIGRLYSSGEPSYCCPGLQTKYVIRNNTLVIKTVTAEDRRFYFCGRKINGSIRFVDTFRLISASSTDADDENQSEQNPGSLLQSKLVVLISLSLNAIFGLVLVGLICFLCYPKRKNNKQQVDNPETYTCENPEPAQYEEIQFRTDRVAAPSSECVYYKAQLPRC